MLMFLAKRGKMEDTLYLSALPANLSNTALTLLLKRMGLAVVVVVGTVVVVVVVVVDVVVVEVVVVVVAGLTICKRQHKSDC